MPEIIQPREINKSYELKTPIEVDSNQRHQGGRTFYTVDYIIMATGGIVRGEGAKKDEAIANLLTYLANYYAILLGLDVEDTKLTSQMDALDHQRREVLRRELSDIISETTTDSDSSE